MQGRRRRRCARRPRQPGSRSSVPGRAAAVLPAAPPRPSWPAWRAHRRAARGGHPAASGGACGCWERCGHLASAGPPPARRAVRPRSGSCPRASRGPRAAQRGAPHLLQLIVGGPRGDQARHGARQHGVAGELGARGLGGRGRRALWWGCEASGWAAAGYWGAASGGGGGPAARVRGATVQAAPPAAGHPPPPRRRQGRTSSGPPPAPTPPSLASCQASGPAPRPAAAACRGAAVGASIGLGPRLRQGAARPGRGCRQRTQAAARAKCWGGGGCGAGLDAQRMGRRGRCSAPRARRPSRAPLPTQQSSGSTVLAPGHRGAARHRADTPHPGPLARALASGVARACHAPGSLGTCTGTLSQQPQLKQPRHRRLRGRKSSWVPPGTPPATPGALSRRAQALGAAGARHRVWAQPPPAARRPPPCEPPVPPLLPPSCPRPPTPGQP